VNIKVKDAVILAGGKGSRLQKEINGHSKPMTPILGKKLITFAIDSLLECGINNIYIVYHSSAADILALSTYNDIYSKTLKFIEDLEQKGVLSAFYCAKDFVDVPFMMCFADIIVQKDDFRQMVSNGLNIVDKHTDLLIQSGDNPLIPSEKTLLIKNGTIIKMDKPETIRYESDGYTVKSGGRVYLWFRNPFSLIRASLADGNRHLRQFIQPYIQKHNVLEMSIGNLWDVDTRDDVLQTEKILGRMSTW
jgi:choline kinase